MNDFYSAQGFWSSLLHSSPLLSGLEEIGASGEHLAIPHLAPLLVHKSESIRDAAARTIARLYASVPTAEFAQLEQACRDDWAYESTPLEAWRRLKPSDVPRLLSLPEPEVVIGLTTFHNNGWVREAALEALSARKTWSGIPFILLRLNDWVAEIRRIAAKALSQRLSPNYSPEFIKHLALVFRLRGCGRSDHQPLLQAITALLTSPGSLPALLQGISSEERYIRRECFRLALDASGSDRRILLDRVISDNDPVIRLWASRELLTQANSDELREHLVVLVRDRYRPVRCEALNLWASRTPENALPALDRALFDAHPSVRAIAQYWIRRLAPGREVATSYREVLGLPNDPRLRPAVLGLGETGNVQDAGILLPYLSASKPSFRKAAIRSIAALSRETNCDQLFRALDDPQPGVSREAAKALKPLARALREKLLFLFRTSRLAHVRRNTFSLLLGLPFWPRGVFLFESLRDSDERIVEDGQAQLRNWIEHSRGIATRPTEDELHQLRSALKASSGMFSTPQMRELDFLFRMLAPN